MGPKVVPLTYYFIAPTKALCKRDQACHKVQRGDYEIPAGDGKEAFWGVIKILAWILPMNQINKPVLNFPIGPLPAYCLLTVY